ncbi:hypothetical protein EKH79_15520 [Dyella dinghuensis]|uniref:Tetratricopeptide repeat protein n=1 Tax=Dyella dinghuensis TaxID=1920169 RepID=A0A3S0RCU2_9GAMM|nr:hypothetical protein [Dyella dinghuensis]RUL62288.1 hypothetical protein EKH79_15520 [Dyella dinghuensis]
MRNWAIYSVAGLLLAVVAFTYWPVVHFDFVWDDWQSFHDTSWLRQGGDWRHYIFRDFNDWTTYFRPLVIAFLALQVHAFDSTPEPMHAVSLALHLLNTLLVGGIAWRCSQAICDRVPQKMGMMLLCMLLYGLHPVLIEPVAWIGCQFDLIATMFMLLGLLLNARIQNDITRAPVVGLIFFLAACSKESAASFPFLVFVFDWALLPKTEPFDPMSAARSLIRQHWKTYCGIVVAGLLYLMLRDWALGGVLVKSSAARAPTFLQRPQEVCAAYLHYWRTLIWPMPEMGPLHLIDTHLFTTISVLSLVRCAMSLSILAIASYFAVRRASSLGAIVLAASFALLPVLHISPVTFDVSLYHERYVMTALSVVCAMLPLVLIQIPMKSKVSRYVLATVTAFWFLLAIVDIRATLPNWSNDINLWKWALAMYPDSPDANINLMAAYVRYQDYTDLGILEDQQLANPTPCVSCMLTLANIAADQKDPRRAILALGNASQSKQLTRSRDGLHLYYLAMGKVLILQGQRADAEKPLEIAQSLSPLDVRPRLVLAHDLASEGKSDLARQLGTSAIQDLPEDQRPAMMQALNEAIEKGRKNHTAPQESENERPADQ